MTESYEKDDYMSDLVNFNSPASHHYLQHLNHGQHGNVNQYHGGGGSGTSNSSYNTSINGHATVDGDIPAEEDEMLLWRARRLVGRFLQAHTVFTMAKKSSNCRMSDDNALTKLVS